MLVDLPTTANLELMTGLPGCSALTRAADGLSTGCCVPVAPVRSSEPAYVNDTKPTRNEETRMLINRSIVATTSREVMSVYRPVAKPLLRSATWAPSPPSSHEFRARLGAEGIEWLIVRELAVFDYPVAEAVENEGATAGAHGQETGMEEPPLSVSDDDERHALRRMPALSSAVILKMVKSLQSPARCSSVSKGVAQ